MGRKTGKKAKEKAKRDRAEPQNQVMVKESSQKSTLPPPPQQQQVQQQVVVDDTGQRLDTYLASALKITRSRVGRAAKGGMVTVNGKAAKASQKLKIGQVVAFRDVERAGFG